MNDVNKTKTNAERNKTDLNKARLKASKLRKLGLSNSNKFEILDQITQIQCANTFVLHCLTHKDGIQLNSDQQVGLDYFFRKIDSDLESIKLRFA